MTQIAAEIQFPNAATPPGSSNYYSLRFAPAKLRSELALILLWHQELWRIRDDCHDPGVARLKLDWWRYELGQTMIGRGQHPMSPALADIIRRHRLPAVPFLGIVDAVEQDILRTRYQRLEEVMQYARSARGGTLELLARITGADEEAIETARELGIGIRLVEMLQDLGGDLRQQRCYLPVESLNLAGLTIANMTAPASAGALQSFLAGFSKHIQQHHETAIHRSRTVRRSSLGPALAMASIALATLKEIGASDFQVLHQHIRLTPWRALWIAWKAQH